MEINKIYQGDCMDFTSSLPEDYIDLCIIDPPYNVGYNYNEYSDVMLHEEYMKRQIDLIQEIECKLKYGGSLIYITYPELAAEIYTYFKYHGASMFPNKWITWVYNTNLGGKYLRKASRGIIWFSKSEPKKNEIKGEYKNPTDKRIKERIENGEKPKEMDWFYIDQVKNVSKEHDHPCEIPQDLLIKFIDGLTEKGDLVYDCFMGSGSTAIASKKLGRNYLGVELDQKYVELGNNRAEKTQSSLF